MIINTRIEPHSGKIFEEHCLDINIGETVPFMIAGSDFVGQGTITAVTVAEDGSHAWLTIEVPNVVSSTVDIGPVHLSAQEGPGFSGYAEETL